MEIHKNLHKEYYMSGMDYLHGAAAQELIDGFVADRRVEGLAADYQAVLARKNAEIRDLRDTNDRLRKQYEAVREGFGEKSNEVVNKHIAMSVSQEYLANKMAGEAQATQEDVYAWITRFGDATSRDFIEGLRQWMKDTAVWSRNEELRKQFIKEYEKEAFDYCLKNSDRWVDEDVLKGIAKRIGLKLYMQAKDEESRRVAEINGKTVFASPRNGGPDNLAEAYGKDNFTSTDTAREQARKAARIARDAANKEQK
jgi:hypothetical protein